MEEVFIKERSDKIKSFLKENYVIIAILLFAIILRIYYFFLTKNQPLWWDEADYLAYAKNLAGFNMNYIIDPNHNSFFPYLVAIFFKLGFSEIVARAFLLLIPSILIVFLIYKICLLMYEDKRIALISSFLMSVLLPVIFNTMRFHLAIPALFFGLLSIYVFFQGYERREKIFGKINPKWAIPLTVFLVILTYSIRRGYFLFGFFFLFYMFFTRRFKDLIKDKYNWIALFIGVVLVFLLDKFIFIASLGEIAGHYFQGGIPFNLLPFGVFSAFFKTTNIIADSLFYLFYLGLILIIINLILSLGHIKKTQNKEIKSDLFAFLTIAVVLSYFLFYQKQTDLFGEARWYFPLLLGTFICISRATLLITNYVKKYNKYFALLILILLIGSGGYYQFKAIDPTIKIKIDSYAQVKDSGLWMKENSNPDDIIISASVPQHAYYSERTIQSFYVNDSQMTEEQFIEKIKEIKPKYMVVSIFEPGFTPEWAYTFAERNSQLITPVQGSFLDSEKSQLALIIYRVNV